MRAAAVVLMLVVAGALAGCGGPADGPTPTAPTGPTTPTGPSEPPLVFAGQVVDALSAKPLPEATVDLNLAFVQPCQRPGITWAGWQFGVADNGSFGPEEVPRPNSDDLAFFFEVSAPGFGHNQTYIGPDQARALDLQNLTFVLHPSANVSGTAPAGTVLALEAPPFPRLSVAADDGAFAFADARAVRAPLVAALATPRAVLVAPQDANATNLTFEADGTQGWRLEGSLRLESGAPVAGDVVARSDGVLVSAARASDTGTFVLPLPARGATVAIEARSPEGQFGGARTLEIQGPPAVVENVVMRRLC